MSYTAELIAVGTELLLGSISNTDAQMLSQGLSGIGINVFYHTVVGDNPPRLSAAVTIAKSRADIIITTGGLGPTCDDLTKQVLAASFGKQLVFHEPTAQRIRDFFAQLHPHRPMTDNNLQQAMLPEGCVVFENDWGTAPGCAFEVDGVHVIMLPGPPAECTPMFRHRALPYLAALSDGTILSRSLRIFGMGESAVEDLLRDKMNMENPTLAPYAKEGEVELRMTAKACTREVACQLIAPVEAELRALLGSVVYDADDGVNISSIEKTVLQLLARKGLTFGTAESCTGGLIAKRITDLAGASAVFRGGVVSYASEVKRDVLDVSQALLDDCGAVSPQVATAMAEGARRILGCDLAVATTGVAGPDSDERGNPVGLVYIALVGEGLSYVQSIQAGPRRGRVRFMAASAAFDMVRRYLTDLSLE